MLWESTCRLEASSSSKHLTSYLPSTPKRSPAFRNIAMLSNRMVACIATPRFSLRCISALSIHTPQSILQSSRQHRGNGSNSFNTKRNFSDNSSWQDDFEGLISRRNKNIIMHPEVYFDFESPSFVCDHFDYSLIIHLTLHIDFFS